MIKLAPGQTKMYKISKKFASPKLITSDNEINNLYIGTKYTRGYIWKVHPQFQVYGTSTTLGLPPTGSNNQAIPTCISSYAVSWQETFYTSFYVNGDDNPNVLMPTTFEGGYPTTGSNWIYGGIYGTDGRLGQKPAVLDAGGIGNAP